MKLDLYECFALKELPAGIFPPFAFVPELCMNCAWTDRNISSSVVLNHSLSEGFGQLRSLVKLHLWGCTQLRALPEGIPPRILPLSAALAILNRPCIN